MLPAPVTRPLHWLVAAVVGSAVALGLAAFMSSLITGTQLQLDTSERAHMLDFVRVKRAESMSMTEFCQ